MRPLKRWCVPKKVDACLKLESILPNAPLSHTWVLARQRNGSCILACLDTYAHGPFHYLDASRPKRWLYMYSDAILHLLYKMPSLAGGLLACWLITTPQQYHSSLHILLIYFSFNVSTVFRTCAFVSMYCLWFWACWLITAPLQYPASLYIPILPLFVSEENIGFQQERCE